MNIKKDILLISYNLYKNEQIKNNFPYLVYKSFVASIEYGVNMKYIKKAKQILRKKKITKIL